jgi:hypothetical protein
LDADRAPRLKASVMLPPLDMTNNRRLNLGAVALVKGKVRNSIPTMTAVRDEFESVLAKSAWFPSAPFKSIGLILRYGTKTNLAPEFQRIHRPSGELEIAVELSMEELQVAHREQGKLESLTKAAIAGALLGVAEKYNLPKNAIEDFMTRTTEA